MNFGKILFTLLAAVIFFTAFSTAATYQVKTGDKITLSGGFYLKVIDVQITSFTKQVVLNNVDANDKAISSYVMRVLDSEEVATSGSDKFLVKVESISSTSTQNVNVATIAVTKEGTA